MKITGVAERIEILPETDDEKKAMQKIIRASVISTHFNVRFIVALPSTGGGHPRYGPL